MTPALGRDQQFAGQFRKSLQSQGPFQDLIAKLLQPNVVTYLHQPQAINRSEALEDLLGHLSEKSGVIMTQT